NMSNAGTLHMGTAGTVSGSVNTATLDYGGYGVAVTFNLNNAAGTTTGVGTTWRGVTSVNGSAASDTMAGTNRTYNLTAANAGNSGGIGWTSFEMIANAGTGTVSTSGGQVYNLTGANAGTVTTLLPGGFTGIGNLTDSGAATFNMGAAGSVSGNLAAAGGSISYASYATPATFNLNGSASTGMAGWNGITSVTGSAGSDTIRGAGQTYTVSGSNAGNNAAVSWTSMENLTDLSGGSLRATSATWTLNGANTGSVTNLSGAFTGMGNLADLGTGTFNMHGSGNGSISGNLNAGTNGMMSYAGYTSPVTASLSGAAGTTTGVGGTRTGIRSIAGSSNSDTITGSGATYNLTSQNAGNSSGLSWSSFENISDASGGTFNLSV